MANRWRDGYWRDDNFAYLTTPSGGAKWRDGERLEADNSLAITTDLTPANLFWRQGFLRWYPGGALVVANPGTPPLKMQRGYLRDVNGALVITNVLTGAVVRQGELRAPNGALVTTSAQGGARTSSHTPSVGLTYYISPTGNDTTGDGSFGLPWQSMQKAHDYLRFTAVWPAGQDIRIYMRAGVYQAPAASLATCDIAWDQVGKKPTASQWVIWERYPGDGAVVIKPPSGLTGNKYGVRTTSTGAFVADYQQFRSLEFDGEQIVKGDGDVVGIFLTNFTTQVEVVDCVIHGMRANYVANGGAAARKAQGVYIDPNAQNNHLYRTRVYDIGANLGTINNQEHGIYCSGNNNKFYDCLVYDCPNGYGLQLYNGGAIMSGEVVANCTIGGTFEKSCIVVHGNSVNCVFKNLILRGATEYGIEFYPAASGAGSGNVIDHVVYYQNTVGNRSAASPGGWTITNEQTGDPLFVDYPGRNFDLAGGGPAINFADSAYAGATDIAGVARPIGAEDAGCYEF